MMKKFFPLSVLSFLAICSGLHGLPEHPEHSDLSLDPLITKGSLENGVTYFVKENTKPESKLSLRLFVGAGAMDEVEDQRGVAHFLEHMLFDGSPSFKPGELIPHLQNMGMSFGQHVNAYTSFDSTVYMLDLPDTKDDTLETCFTVLKEYAHGALLDAEEIEKERGVILAEKISRDSISSRLFTQKIELLLPDSLLPERFPIGVEEVIKTIPRQRMVDFYENYYTSNNIAVVVVGDMETAKIEALVKKYFGSIPARKSERYQDYGKVTPLEKNIYKVLSDSELSRTSVDFTITHPYTKQVDSKSKKRTALTHGLMNQMISTRLQTLAEQENAPIIGGYAYEDTLANHAHYHTLSVSTESKQWPQAVQLLEQEFRKTLEFGFIESELELAKTQFLKILEKRKIQATTVESSTLAIEIINKIEAREIPQSAQQELELFKEIAPTITVDSVHRQFKKIWDNPHLISLSTSNDELTDNQLEGRYIASQQDRVTAPAAEKLDAFAYENLGKPVSLKSTTTIEDLNITHHTLSNGIQVLARPSEYAKGNILINLTFTKGRDESPNNNPALAAYASELVSYSGTQAHSRPELSKILAAESVDYSVSTSTSSTLVSASTTPKSLLKQLQLLCGVILEPAFRPEVDAQLQKYFRNKDQELLNSSAGSLEEIRALIYGKDARFKQSFLSKEYAALTLDDARKWIAPILLDAPLLVTISGDFDSKTLPALLEQTFATLPERQQLTVPAELAVVSSIKKEDKKNFAYESKIDRAHSILFWKTDIQPLDINRTRQLSLLTKILNNRVRETIREEIGATYSPRVYAVSDKEIKRTNLVRSDIICDPELLDQVEALTLKLAKELGEKGASQDEFNQVQKPLIKSLKEYRESNAYWVKSVMNAFAITPETFDWAREMERYYETISLEDINQLAAQTFSAQEPVTFTIQNHPVEE